MDCDKAMAMTGLWCCCSRNALITVLKVMTSTAPDALAAHGDSVAVRELGRYLLAGALRHRLHLNVKVSSDAGVRQGVALVDRGGV
jgi:hypothetical protein